MKHIVTLSAFVASVITIGDFCIKLAAGLDYDYVTSMMWILAVVFVQLIFAWLLELEFSESEAYVVVLFSLLVPVCLVAGCMNYHVAVTEGELETIEIMPEILKSLLFFSVVSSLPVAWSWLCRVQILHGPGFLGVMFALPCLLVTSLGIERYILKGRSLDYYSAGYFAFILIAPALAALTKFGLEASIDPKDSSA